MPPMKQIYPASITGKGFAEGGSVLDHRFGSSEPFTLGVEEEYMLLDAQTFDLVQHVDTVLTAAMDGEFDERVGPELMQSVLEISTPVCKTVADVEGELRKLRAHVARAAGTHGLRGLRGTHPFSLFERQRITARDRYRNLVDQLQYVARRELIFGCHIHVAVDDPDKAIHVISALLVHLSELLALSASSPFWRGEPTGLSSSRQMVFAAFPAPGRRRASATTTTTRGGRPAREDRMHRRLHAHLVGRPAASALRDDRGAGDGRDHARGGDRRITAYVQGLVKHYLELYDAQGAARLPPHPRDREQVARRPLRPRGAGHGLFTGAATACRSRSSSAGRCATSSRTRASSVRPRARGHPRHSPGERRRPPAQDLQRQPGHRRGDARDLRRDGGGSDSHRMIGVGDPIPDVQVWRSTSETVGLRELAAESPYLLLSYLFDWSSTCTNELSELNARRNELLATGVAPYGISRALVPRRLAAGARPRCSPAPTDGEAVRALGIVQEFRGLPDVARRAAFVVDEEGIIRGAWRYGASEVSDFDMLVESARSLS